MGRERIRPPVTSTINNQQSTIVIHQSIGVVPQEKWFPRAKIRRGRSGYGFHGHAVISVRGGRDMPIGEIAMDGSGYFSSPALRRALRSGLTRKLISWVSSRLMIWKKFPAWSANRVTSGWPSMASPSDSSVVILAVSPRN